MAMGRGLAAGAMTAAVLVMGLPATAGAADAASVHPTKRCTSHSLHLAGPHRAKVGDAVTYRVTDRHGHPARDTKYRALRVRGNLPVADDGRFRTQFSGAQVYRLMAYRGSNCSNVLVVHVHR